MSNSYFNSPLVIKPYLEKSVECPICGEQSVQAEMKTRLFAERDRDVDLKPGTYLWAIKDLEWCHPPLYYMWSCPVCSFTAGHAHFPNPSKSLNVHQAAFNKAIQNLRARPFHHELSELLSRPSRRELPRTFLGGFALHFLAIYFLEGVEDVTRKETIELGKYYLRTAWLFRDLGGKSLTEEEQVSSLLTRAKDYWPEIPKNEKECLERAALYLENGLETSTAITSTREEIELILLIARIWMKAGDTRRARNLGAYSRERIAKYEMTLEQGEKKPSPEETGELFRLKLTQSEVLNILSDLTS